ncbi:hypothetical protein LguiB_013701 [Lonicera macranthoides]
MGSRRICLRLYWGGNIINGKEGWTYDKPHKSGIILNEGNSYSELVEKVYSAMGNDRTPSTLKMTCRCPRFVTTITCDYFLHEIKDDGSLEFAMAIIFNAPAVIVIDLYIEKVNLDYDVYPIAKKFPLSGPCGSSPLIQCTRMSTDPLQRQEFTGLANEGRHLSLFGSTSRSSRSHNFGGTSKKCHKSSQSTFESMAGGECGIYYDLDAEYRIGDDVNSEFEGSNDYINSESDEEEKTNEIGQVNVDTPSFYTQFKVINMDKEVLLQDQMVGENELRNGLIYETKAELKHVVKSFAINNSNEFIVDEVKADIWTIRCKLHENGCKWRLRACKMKKEHWQFEITKYEGPHTCRFNHLKLRYKHLDCNFIASKIIHMVKVDPALKFHVIVVFIKNQYGYKISSWKAWRAKQMAIATLFGDWKESYAIMPRYLSAIKFNNEGTIHEFSSKHFDGNYRIFDKNFWAFNGSIEGFVHCRPLISIDATHLRGMYNGKLFVAMVMDANEEIFPLAFGYGDEESYDTWHYFLKQLWYYVVKGREGICLLSDCHRSILAVINSNEEFQEPRTYHRFCMRHVLSNFTRKCKPDQTLRLLMWKAATAYQLPKFNHYMEKIKEYDEQQQIEEKKPWKWLNEIPLEKWTFVHDGGHRYGVSSINISEVFNGDLIKARSLPVTSSVHLIFHLLVTYFCQRRQQGVDMHANSELEYTPFMALKFEEFKNKVKKYSVFRHSEGSTTVISSKGKIKNVNIKERTCTCGRWSVYKYPCSHVMAVCVDQRLEPKYLIDPYLSLDAYVASFAPTINPALPKEYWKGLIPSIASVLIPNPIMLRQKNRPSRHIYNKMDINDRRRSNHISGGTR